MTLPSGSNGAPISLSEINSDVQDGYGLGTDLNAYRGKIYDDKAGGVGVFSSGAISLSDFYNRRRVDSGSSSDTVAGTRSVTVPKYRTITITVKGSGGGGGGGGGGSGSSNCGGFAGGSGGGGNSSTFGNVGDAWRLSALGGGAGGGGNGWSSVTPGTNGTDYGGGNGGAGGNGKTGFRPGTNGGNGGGGQSQTITLTNPALGGTGPTSGASISYTNGAASSGGSAGVGRDYNGAIFACYSDATFNGSAGNGGTAGTMSITWTGTG